MKEKRNGCLYCNLSSSESNLDFEMSEFFFYINPQNITQITKRKPKVSSNMRGFLSGLWSVFRHGKAFWV